MIDIYKDKKKIQRDREKERERGKVRGEKKDRENQRGKNESDRMYVTDGSGWRWGMM